MAFRVFIDKAAEKDIDRLPKNIRTLVLEEIEELAKDPRKPRAEPLEGKLKPYWKEIYRILGRMQRSTR